VTAPVERLAAIDVGSNTILLLIAEYDPAAGLTIIQEAEDQPRLGAGLSATGRLSEAAIERALHSLIRMRDLCRSRGVARIAAVATAAVRDAENGSEFAARAQALNVPLRVISPETEAALAYRSAAHHFPGGGRLLVADIGGGSLELIGAAEGRIQLIDSLPLGAVRLTELELQLPALRDHVRRMLQRAIPGSAWKGSRVIGSGGTFANLASILLARRGIPGKPIHGTDITAAELESLLAGLAGMAPEQRRQVPGLKPERADIIVAGLAVAAELLERVGSAGVTVSGFGVREGLLLEMAAKNLEP
jgi:exopolyphosphatase / guanosine-5'-triphosphate,3'-diphosphate pyrophosphatase